MDRGKSSLSPITLGRAFTFNLRFPGHYYDVETGRHYNYFRYYDPEIGRYAAKDPIGFAGGDTNLFGYVANDPVNFVDPEGLASYRARDFEDVRWGDLAFAVVDFTASTTEAAFGVGGMIASTGSGPAAPAVFLGSLGMASHGVYGMSNSAISAHNALYTREMSGVAESVGGALFGARGARAGEAVDIFGAIRPGAQAAACFDSAIDIFDAANSLNHMDNNFDN